nr:824_t:CDS:2 [Entrophospora candida]
MTSGRHGPYALGDTRATMVRTKRCQPARGSQSQKTNLSSDWRLQLASMKSELLVIANQPCCERIQSLQNHLAQIQTALATLTTNINQTETSLQTKRTEYEQSPEDSLQTEITQLESQLTTYKNRKQKIETLIPKLQTRIGNLGKGENNTDTQKQESIIQELEKDIQEINKELGIKVEEPRPSPGKNPNPPTPPSKDNPFPPDLPEPPSSTPPSPNDSDDSDLPPPPNNDSALDQLKKEALDKIENPTPEEEEKIKQADGPAKIKKELSGILRDRILSDISNYYICDYNGTITDFENDPDITYEKGVFVKNDYQKIRKALIQEIIDNPGQ